MRLSDDDIKTFYELLIKASWLDLLAMTQHIQKECTKRANQTATNPSKQTATKE